MTYIHKSLGALLGFLSVLMLTLPIRDAVTAQELRFDGTVDDPPHIDLPIDEDYKTLRLREMADMWKGTVLESRTVPLLAMLLVENGALSESTRGDHGYAIGLEQNHLCKRGFTAPDFPTKRYCGSNPEDRFAKDIKGTEWEGYLTDWRVQFKHYTILAEGMTNKGYSADDIIRSWNSLEAGRRHKVSLREDDVRKALDL